MKMEAIPMRKYQIQMVTHFLDIQIFSINTSSRLKISNSRKIHLHPDDTEVARSLAGPKLSKKLGLDEKLVLLERAEEKYNEMNKQVW